VHRLFDQIFIAHSRQAAGSCNKSCHLVCVLASTPTEPSGQGLLDPRAL